MKHMKAFSLIIVLLVVVTANDALACSCVAEANPFLKVAPKSVLVIRANDIGHVKPPLEGREGMLHRPS
jgi:hypothetical protein